jgi:hypothetical protein
MTTKCPVKAQNIASYAGSALTLHRTVGRTTGGTFCRDKITVNGEERTEHAERSDVTPDG